MAAAQDKISDVWTQQQQAWNDHVALLRQHIDEKKGELDSALAGSRAESAEADAMFAIDFAYSAIEEAEYATLRAILARADANDAEAKSGGVAS